MLALAGLAWLGEAQAGPAAGKRESETITHTAYLPVLLRAPGEIYGRVTQNGAAAGGMTLSLRYYNGTTWTTASTTTTDGDGRYRFVKPAALAGNQIYQVQFVNTTANEGRLGWWNTRPLTSYAMGAYVEIGNFDIGAVTLSAPQTNLVTSLPVTFSWVKRAATPGDSYAVRVYDAADLNPMWVGPGVGYTGEYTLNSVPSGCSTNTAYTWDVMVLSADGGMGASRQTRIVTLGAGINGRLTQNGGGAGGVMLQLRYFDGSAWSTRLTTTTQTDGRYVIISAPTLAAGQKYYVRYQNVSQVEGRLFLWSTQTLTAYLAGSNVDLGSFDIADVPLNSPAGGAVVTLPTQFTWTRRASTPTDSYGIEISDPSDYSPRWLSALVGYNQAYTLNGLPTGLSIQTQYAWDVIIYAPNGGSGVSRIAHLVRFANLGSGGAALVDETAWPFEEPLPERPAESYDNGE
jgi:5-hydroxyisourate hydrolase-like protein (transthyretin family)